MNKILRLSFISLLMMLCGTTFADETTIWSEDWQSAEAGTLVEDVSNSSATYVGDGNYVKLYANTSDASNIELLLPKSSREVDFQANVKVDGGSSLKLTFTVNKDVEVTSSTTGAELTKVSNTEYAIKVPTGVSTLNLTFKTTVDQNARLDNILLVTSSSEGGGGETPDPQSTGDNATFDFTTADGLKAMGVAEANIPTVEASAEAGVAFETTGPFTMDGVTITATDGGTNASRIWSPKGNDGTKYDFRVYGNDDNPGTVTFTAPSGKNITSIVITAGSTWNEPTPSSGAFDDKSWTGNANSVTFTQTKQCQYKKVVVTYGEGGDTPAEVAIPVISGTTEFEESTTVTITCADEDNVIYYSTGGDFQEYVGPFTLTETTTVKAYTEDVLGEVSKTVEKTFTKKEKPAGVEAANIAEFLALPDKTQNITLTLTNARVLAFGKNNVIVNDGTGGMDIYKLSGVTVKQGDVLNGTVTGPRSDYNNVPELNTPTANTITVTEGTITATKTTVAAIAAEDELFTDLFKLENVEVVEEGGKYYAKDGDKQIQIYTNQLGIGSLAAGTFTIEGVVGTYKTDKQFWPTSMESSQPIEVVKAADIAALKALDKGKEAELTLTNAQVLYAWKSTNGNVQAYVRDASGAMCFDFRGSFAAAGEKFETNKIVNGTIMVTNSVYNGLPQASAYADTNDENLTFADGSEAQAVSTTIPNVKNYICDLVEIEIDEIVSDGAEKPKYYAKSGDDQIQIYNQFHVADYEALSAFVGPASKIKGIAVIYQTASMEEPIYEIYPVADGIEQATVAEDAPELQAPEGWTKAVSNGNLAGEDVKNYISKEAPSTEPVEVTIVAGAGKDGSRGIVVKSADDPSQAWDTQFWIKLDEALPAGTKLHVQFDYMANKAAKASTQAHGNPGAYQHWACIGDVNFTTEWQTYSTDIEVSSDMATGSGGNGLLSIAFNLSEEKTATEYHFDNFGVWYQKPAPVSDWADLIVNGDMEGDDMQCFYATEQGVGGPFVASTTPGIGKDGGKAIKVQSADEPANDWATQFFIRVPYQVPAGTKFRLSFDYKADVAGSADTQCHAEPGQYIHYTCAGSPSFTTEWQSYEYEGTIPSQCDGSLADDGFKKIFQTIAFNLAKNKVATGFIFDNVKFEVPKSVAESLTPNPSGIETVRITEPQNNVRYNLSGVRVNENYKGIVIMNGRKYIVK